jgi:anti-sigma B factor antagonist
MVQQPFEAQVQHPAPQVAVLALRGQLDGTAADALHAAFAAAAATAPAAILLDCSAVDYINSTGIALIVGLLERARAAGQRLLACGLSDHYARIFHITRLSDFIALFPDVPTALASQHPQQV